MRVVGKNKKYLTTYISKNSINVGTNLNRQQFDEAFFRSNVIVSKTNIIKKYNSLTSRKPGFLIIPYQVDIDDKNDFVFANFLMQKNKKY